MIYRLLLTIYLTAWTVRCFAWIGTVREATEITFGSAVAAALLLVFSAGLGALAALEWVGEELDNG